MELSPATSDHAAVEAVHAALVDAAAHLAEVGARTEALAEYVPARRTLLVPRAERLRPIGDVWRLGVVLLASGAGGGGGASTGGAKPALYATGALTRSHEPGRPTYQAASAERRRQLRVAAYRGHFRPGTTVNFDAKPIPIDASLIGASGPLTVRDGVALVRWSESSTFDADALTPFIPYLAERVALLAAPPEGP
jgi:hypothetical protein